jgi:hypothetical protein
MKAYNDRRRYDTVVTEQFMIKLSSISYKIFGFIVWGHENKEKRQLME